MTAEPKAPCGAVTKRSFVACTSSNLVVDVAIKKFASVALDQSTGDCHGDRPYGAAQIDFSQAARSH